MTTVGAIAGLGLATGTLNYATIAEIISWWVVTPIIGFWIGGIIGRYIYPEVNRRVTIENRRAVADPRSTGAVPKPALGPNTTWTEIEITVVVLAIGCYMAFSAGASNVPNAAAPLVGEAGLDVNTAVIIATVAIGLGGFTIARRTMDSVGGELSDIPLLAALFVMVTASTITTILSWIGIPISLVMATVMTIVGIGWGRATRPITFREAVTRDPEMEDREIELGAIVAEEEEDEPAPRSVKKKPTKCFTGAIYSTPSGDQVRFDVDYRPVDVHHSPTGSSHSFRASPDGRYLRFRLSYHDPCFRKFSSRWTTPSLPVTPSSTHSRTTRCRRHRPPRRRRPIDDDGRCRRAHAREDISEAAAERAEPVFERALEIADDRDREIETIVGIGHPARNVVDRADDYDTVVIGAHGSDRGRSTRRFLVGNVAETVSKRAPIPVTIVR